MTFKPSIVQSEAEILYLQCQELSQCI